MPSACDVAIVGGGPAGSRAALTLARRGARVSLFDGSHPREKPCGGGITGRALALVADEPTMRSLPAVTIRGARFTDAARESVLVPLDDGDPMPPLIVASRTEFDRRLFDAAVDAGATMVPQRVCDVAVTSGGVELRTGAGTWRAGLVIGADGTNSLVRRRVAAPFARNHLSIATGFFAHGVTSDEVVVELVREPPGYIWSFPRTTHLAIGICTQADAGVTAGVLRAHLLDWIRRTGIARGARLEPYSWPIPSLSAGALDRLSLCGDRWFLVGDAAGLVDPITREGIFFALQSALWAAEAACEPRSRAGAYMSRVRDEIVSDLIHAARLKAGFFRPRFTAHLLYALASSARVRAVMADLIAGQQPYATLKRRLLLTLEMKLAWELLRIERRAIG